ATYCASGRWTRERLVERMEYRSTGNYGSLSGVSTPSQDPRWEGSHDFPASHSARPGSSRLSVAVRVALALACVAAFATTMKNFRQAAVDSAMAGASNLESVSTTTTSGSATASKPSLTTRNGAEHPSLLRGEAVPHDYDEPDDHPIDQKDQDETLTIKADFFYHERDGKPGSAYPWLDGTMIVEPYRDTWMTLRLGSREGMTYRWTVTPSDPEGEIIMARGEAPTIVYKTPGHNVIVVEEVSDETGEVMRRSETTVLCMYVRREIRTLLEDERQALFDAMRIMWDVSTEEGRKIYGEGYTSAWDLNVIHFIAGGDLECDHFHHGLGFVTSHVLITNVFEASLQSINPMLTMPYWDYTIETSQGEDSEFKDISPMFDPTWFGDTDDDNQVVSGRWGNMTIPDAPEFLKKKGMTNVYGALRSPWNTNHRDYMTRGMGKFCNTDSFDIQPLPKCADHYSLLNDYDTYYGWAWFSMVNPHGPMHLYLGSLLDCEYQFDEIAKLLGEDTTIRVRQIGITIRKQLYRDGLLKCADDAPEDLTSFELYEQGYCGCIDLDLEQGDDFNLVLDSLSLQEKIIKPAMYDEPTRRQVAKLLCNFPVNDGDHVQSSSPLDPTFWPLHPTMERLWQYKVLSGTMTDTTWPDSSAVYTDEDGEEYEIVVASTDSGTCLGHGGSDKFPFGFGDHITDLMVNIWHEPKFEEYTNREVLAALDPNFNGLPYIYDTFEWTHCEEQGY
ncbi:unnamed protein product, partial [Discosporangium mesarthrocarpum]